VAPRDAPLQEVPTPAVLTRNCGDEPICVLTLLPDSSESSSTVLVHLGEHAGHLRCGEFSARPTGAGRAEFLVGNPLDPAAIASDRGGSSLEGGPWRWFGRRWGVRERFRGSERAGGHG